MKSRILAGLLLALAIALVASIGCAGPSVRAESESIRAACKGVTLAANAIAAGAESGQVTKAQAREALEVASTTKAFCEPKPAEHLNAADYADLLDAAADLAARKARLR